ncbi:MAG: thiamine-phosphate kinase [Alphaproteobacteria bacterium]|nr:MAG: thiamine-phosphate kinase [Alphaproteobacteria bacterium]
MKEFSLIDKYFRPLTRDFTGALELRDDAGYLTVPAGQELVVTKDLLLEDVHFFGDDDPGLIAQKSLRVNLSDLAAKGARPLAYSLGLVLPLNRWEGVNDSWLAQFAKGLEKDQKQFGISLLGGDTTSGDQLTISIAAYGLIPNGRRILRGGAKPGDIVFTTGTIGDAGAVLYLKRKKMNVPPELMQRYLLPQPRLGLIEKLREAGAVNAAIDVSDGLMADLRHILDASGTGGKLYLKQMPVSPQAQDFINHFNVPLESLAGMGDDYEIVFTSPVSVQKQVQEIANSLNIPVQAIGEITVEKEYRIFNGQGQKIQPIKLGYEH